MLDYLRTSPVAQEPRGQHRKFVVPLLAEMYVLGERPSLDEVRDYLARTGDDYDAHWRGEILRLWRERLKSPTRNPRGRNGWSYPFVIPESVVEDRGLRPIPERLLAALATAAADYITLATDRPSSEEAQTAASVFAVTANAVRLWALTRDRIEDSPWPNVMKQKRGYDTLAEASTHAGRARMEERHERWRREADEELARARELGLLDK